MCATLVSISGGGPPSSASGPCSQSLLTDTSSAVDPPSAAVVVGDDSLPTGNKGDGLVLAGYAAPDGRRVGGVRVRAGPPFRRPDRHRPGHHPGRSGGPAGPGAAVPGGTGWTVSSTCWPYLASFVSPTPLTWPSSASDDGRVAAISRSVASWKITYAGTPCSFATPARHARNCSNSPTASAGRSAGSPRAFAALAALAA